MKNKEKRLFDVFVKAFRQKESPPLSESIKTVLLSNIADRQNISTEKPLILSEAARTSLLETIREQNFNPVVAREPFDNALHALRIAHRDRHTDLNLSAKCREEVLRNIRLTEIDDVQESAFWSLLWPTVRLMTPITCVLFFYGLSLQSTIATDYPVEQFILGEVTFK